VSQPFKLRYQNEIVGVFLVGAFVVILLAVLLVARDGREIGDGFECEIVFREPGVGLLREGVAVRVQSQRAGIVTGSSVGEDGHVRAHVVLSNSMRYAISTDSSATLYTPMAGLAGEPYIEIAIGKAPTRLAIGGQIEGAVAGDVLQLTTDVLRVLRSDLGPSLMALRKISERGDRMLAKAEMILELPATATAAEAMFARADRAAERAERALERTLGLLERLEGTLDKTDAALAGAGRLVSRIEKGEGLVGRALADPVMERRVVELVGRLAGTLDTVERLMAQTGKAVAVAPELVAEGRAALRDMAIVAAELRRIAPAVPSMAGQVEELLGEGRAVLGAVERHWLLGAQLRPKGAPAPLPAVGIRDDAGAPDLEALRRALAPRARGAVDAR
jgi:ABC-type transporter Mla subunit MlaD